MPAKTTLSAASCPLNKWNKSETSQENKDYKLDE